MNNRNHIVSRQVLDINLASKDGAYEKQNQLRDIYYKQCLPVMADIFDQFANERTTLRFGKLEIDIGDISAKSLESQFVAKLRFRLEEALLKATPMRNEMDTDAMLKSSSEEHRSAFEILIYFLKTGTLPWWVPAKTTVSPQEMFLEQISHSPKALWKFIVSNYSQHSIIQRLVYQFTDDSILSLIRSVSNGEANTIMAIYREAMLLFQSWLKTPGLSKEEQRFQIWQTILVFLLSHNNSALDESSLIRTVLQKIIHQANRPGASLIPAVRAAMMKTTPDKKPAFVQLQPMLEKIYYELVNEVNHEEAPLADTGASQNNLNESFRKTDAHGEGTGEGTGEGKDQHVHDKNEQGLTEGKYLSEKMTSEAFQQSNSGEYETGMNAHSRSVGVHQLPENYTQLVLGQELNQPGRDSGRDDDQEFEAIAIGNAGLIILAPYLPLFFKNLGLVREKKFVSKSAMDKAVHLLHYISNDDENCEEYKLILNKILCGMAIATPVPRMAMVSDKEKNEINTLMTTVIAHWKGLKNTSARGLRSAFLQRDGLISKTETGWQLRAERKAHDVLLDRLPWGFATVRLPWMKTLITTEW